MKIEFKINEKHYGKRFDSVIWEIINLPHLSRNYLSSLIKTHKILVSGEKKKPGYRLKPGDIIIGIIPEPTKLKNKISISPEPIHIKIIYEDDHIIVINKDAGIVVHPAAGNLSGTLVNALYHHIPDIKNIGEDPLRPGIVHRLDKDTTGIMVIAKNNEAFNFLKNEFKYRRVIKKYLCIVTGNLQENSGEIAFPIGRDKIKRKRMSINAPNSRKAETLWKVKKRFNIATLVEAELKTGRTHQIRVHFRAINHPLVGDPLYGFKKRKTKNNNFLANMEKDITRQMLHSWKLSFKHPLSGEQIDFKAPIPCDMKKNLTALSHYLRKQSQ